MGLIRLHGGRYIFNFQLLFQLHEWNTLKQFLAESQYTFDNHSHVYAAQHFNYRCGKETVPQITSTPDQ